MRYRMPAALAATILLLGADLGLPRARSTVALGESSPTSPCTSPATAW